VIVREPFEIYDCVAVAETDAALLVDVDGEETWFPKSHISEESEVQHEGDAGTLIVTRWIAEQKGLA
jgi:hypothetical protein